MNEYKAKTSLSTKDIRCKKALSRIWNGQRYNSDQKRKLKILEELATTNYRHKRT